MHNIAPYRVKGCSVHEDEAAFLFGLTKMIAPRIVVEFGTMSGYTALNFLNAMDPETLLVSYDMNRRPEIDTITDERFRFLQKNQTEFHPDDIGSGLIELVYVDASHDFWSNVATFRAIKSRLAPKAILVNHDTAVWAGREGEREFADWLEKAGYPRLDFHCDHKRRWGFSVFQVGAGQPQVKFM